MADQFVAALDVGTTSVRCHILDKTTTTVGRATAQVILHYPEVGRVEIVPEELWNTIITVLRDAIQDSGLEPREITCLGISTQRCTFTAWDRKTGTPYYNFITWKDVRADSLVREWNDSFTLRGMRAGARCLHMVTRNKRFLAGSVLRMMNTQVTMRLLWALKNVAGLQEAADRGEAMFGTVDTWLLYRLTNGQRYATDVSNASATGFYDPFTMQWAEWALNIFHIPISILPPVCDTAGEFGYIHPDILGARIPIRCLMADQAASLFGSCCFHEGDIKVTLGTGTFMNVNSGRKPHASVQGLYPQIGWRIRDEVVYVIEGAHSDTGSLMEWATRIGLVTNPTDSSQIAVSAKTSDGLCFIPSFSGLQAPINDYQAAAGFLGVKPDTTKDQMVRAILESIVFRTVQLYRVAQDEAKYRYTSIRVDGGVSQNDFVVQMLSNMTGLQVERPCSTEMSVLGAGFLAGMQSGVWKSTDELIRLRRIDQVFSPQHKGDSDNDRHFTMWIRAVDRFLKWYEEPAKV